MQISLSGRRMIRCIFRNKITWLEDMKTNQNWIEKKLEIPPQCSQRLCDTNNCLPDHPQRYTYSLLHYNSKTLSRQISNICGSQSRSTVGIFCSHNILTMLLVWASWISGQKVLLLEPTKPFRKLQGLAREAKVRLILSSEVLEENTKQLVLENNIPLIHVNWQFLHNDLEQQKRNNIVSTVFNNDALISYSKRNVAKTNVTTHEELCAHIKKVFKSWALTKNDKILCMCPSFHEYNEEFIFYLYFAIRAGSQLNMCDAFDCKATWQLILGLNIPLKDRVNILIAEPKAYQQLIVEYEDMFGGDEQMKEYIRFYCFHNIRFMLTCFYCTEPNTLSTWRQITGHYLQPSNFKVEYDPTK